MPKIVNYQNYRVLNPDSPITLLADRDVDPATIDNSYEWHGSQFRNTSPYISDRCLLLRRDALPRPLLKRLDVDPEGADIPADLLDRVVGTTRLPAVLAGYVQADGCPIGGVVYVSASGRKREPGIFGRGYHNLLMTVVCPGDSLEMWPRPDLHGAVLSVWRNGEPIGALMSLFLAPEWRPTVKQFVASWVKKDAAA